MRNKLSFDFIDTQSWKFKVPRESLRFWDNSFEGGTWGCEKIFVFYYIFIFQNVLLHFYDQVFQTFSILPPTLLLPIYVCFNLKK
jgi:hypothetical protein